MWWQSIKKVTLETAICNQCVCTIFLMLWYWCFIVAKGGSSHPRQCWGKTASKCNHFCCTIYVYVCKCKQQCNAAGSSSSLLYDGWWVVSWSGWSNDLISACDWSAVSNMALPLVENGHYVPKYSAHSAFRVLVIEHSQ